MRGPVRDSLMSMVALTQTIMTKSNFHGMRACYRVCFMQAELIMNLWWRSTLLALEEDPECQRILLAGNYITNHQCLVICRRKMHIFISQLYSYETKSMDFLLSLLQKTRPPVLDKMMSPNQNLIILMILTQLSPARFKCQHHDLQTVANNLREVTTLLMQSSI